MTPIFDGLPPQSLAELYELLDTYEPKILAIIRSGADLTPTERRRVDHAIMDASVAAMGPDFEETPDHLRLYDLVGETRALVPLRNDEIPDRGIWKKGDPPTGDPYGDGGAANGYGPRPDTP
ncbi:MAG TPA: hypothetical protein VGC67_18035 [Cellulomonas sp.]